MILVVDDDPAVCRSVRCILQSRGYHVLEAPDGDEAFRLFRRHRSRIRLLVTDVVVPETSGPDLHQALRSLQPSLRVLFMSGLGNDSIIQVALEHAFPFLAKPFHPDQLVRQVKKALDSRAA